jgi:pantetheine-phosphate adenylyltransferase
VGHRALLATAAALAREVRIGLTTAGYLSAHPKRAGARIRPYAVRRAALDRYLTRTFPTVRHQIIPLRDPMGGALDPTVRLLVASGESRAGARAVNRERARRGLRPVRVVLVAVVRGPDGLPVSSTRIREGLVDVRGRRRRPIVVGLSGRPASLAPALRTAVRRALASAGPVVFRAVPPRRGPRRDAPARRAGRAARPGEYGVGWSGDRGRGGAVRLVLADAAGPVGPPQRVAPPSALELAAALGRLLRPRGVGPPAPNGGRRSADTSSGETLSPDRPLGR